MVQEGKVMLLALGLVLLVSFCAQTEAQLTFIISLPPGVSITQVSASLANISSNGSAIAVEDNNECDSFTSPCHEFATCDNLPGVFECFCKAGFVPEDSLQTRGDLVCLDVDECLESSICDILSSQCTNTPGSYFCDCLVGFEPLLGANDSCSDINECDIDICDHYGEHGKCTNTFGSYFCSCETGYYLHPTTGMCQELLQCTAFKNVKGLVSNLLNDIATNGNASDSEYQSTAAALSLSGSPIFNIITPQSSVTELYGGLNDDFFDLLRTYLPCDLSATCNIGNTSYICECLDGFSGDGFSCLDNDECAMGLDNCDSSTATCTNTIGSFTCSCKHGYIGSGLVGDCQDINECENAATCDNHSNCTNTAGSFICLCHEGYTGDGVTCQDLDECNSSVLNRCDAIANCVNYEGGYSCTCTSGTIDVLGDGSFCDDQEDECIPSLEGDQLPCEINPTSLSCKIQTNFPEKARILFKSFRSMFMVPSDIRDVHCSDGGLSTTSSSIFGGGFSTESLEASLPPTEATTVELPPEEDFEDDLPPGGEDLFTTPPLPLDPDDELSSSSSSSFLSL
uniref:fibrillin-1-like isoform X1 n=1 Tax=Ciona intestinalis TaxID=7719 RepID=UPI000EF4B615|nr:fibrillin-1-like isoform X1 [Ciona intestinalis]|eukprot:XP_026690991.1 fibrillin-1-like isoform X1 [Ciona intestinalis]